MRAFPKFAAGKLHLKVGLLGNIDNIVTGTNANTKIVSTSNPAADVVVTDFDPVNDTIPINGNSVHADPTGTADSTQAFQNALTACQQAGGGTKPPTNSSSPLFTVGESASLNGRIVYYPLQSLTRVIPYGFTVSIP